jgi:hypothetical protein
MWPFKRKPQFAERPISFSQVDFTESFADDERLGPEDWISTKALNARTKNPESMGLPSLAADADEVYRIASALSEIRESLPLARDGVYCPICHIANVDLGKLRTPCPSCGRALLQFGWD